MAMPLRSPLSVSVRFRQSVRTKEKHVETRAKICMQSFQGRIHHGLLVDVEAGIDQHRYRTRFGELADQTAVKRIGLRMDTLNSRGTVDMNHGRNFCLTSSFTGNVTSMNGASNVSSKYSA